LKRVNVQTLYIEPGSPWENGYIESFNGKLRDELLDRELLDTILEARYSSSDGEGVATQFVHTARVSSTSTRIEPAQRRVKP